MISTLSKNNYLENFIQLKHNIDEAYGFLADMEVHSLDPIKFRRYTLAFLQRVKRLSTSLRHDLSKIEKQHNYPSKDLTDKYTWDKYGTSTPVTQFIYGIRNKFEHEEIFLPLVMVKFSIAPNTPPIPAQLNLSEFTGKFDGLPLKAYSKDKDGNDHETPITLLEIKYYFSEWGYRDIEGNEISQTELATCGADILTMCKEYMNSVSTMQEKITKTLAAELKS